MGNQQAPYQLVINISRSSPPDLVTLVEALLRGAAAGPNYIELVDPITETAFVTKADLVSYFVTRYGDTVPVKQKAGRVWTHLTGNRLPTVLVCGDCGQSEGVCRCEGFENDGKWLYTRRHSWKIGVNSLKICRQKLESPAFEIVGMSYNLRNDTLAFIEQLTVA